MILQLSIFKRHLNLREMYLESKKLTVDPALHGLTTGKINTLKHFFTRKKH